jgi:hypothetical protein
MLVSSPNWLNLLSLKLCGELNGESVAAVLSDRRAENGDDVLVVLVLVLVEDMDKRERSGSADSTGLLSVGGVLFEGLTDSCCK